MIYQSDVAGQLVCTCLNIFNRSNSIIAVYTYVYLKLWKSSRVWSVRPAPKDGHDSVNDLVHAYVRLWIQLAQDCIIRAQDCHVPGLNLVKDFQHFPTICW